MERSWHFGPRNSVEPHWDREDIREVGRPGCVSQKVMDAVCFGLPDKLLKLEHAVVDRPDQQPNTPIQTLGSAQRSIRNWIGHIQAGLRVPANHRQLFSHHHITADHGSRRPPCSRRGAVRREPPATQLGTDVLDLAGLIASAPVTGVDVVGAVRVVDSLSAGSVIVGGGGGVVRYLLDGPGAVGSAGPLPSGGPPRAVTPRRLAGHRCAAQCWYRDKRVRQRLWHRCRTRRASR